MILIQTIDTLIRNSQLKFYNRSGNVSTAYLKNNCWKQTIYIIMIYQQILFTSRVINHDDSYNPSS